jgi:hypothetical protein
MEYLILNAKKVKETDGVYKGYFRTEFYDKNGKLMAIVPASQKQPRKGIKFFTLNCFKYKINWMEE